MAWNKTGWDDVIGTYASKLNISAGNSGTGLIDCNLASPGKYLNVSIKINIVFGDSSDSNPVIKIFGKDVNGADEQDTIPIYNQEIEYQTSQTVIETLPNIDTSSLDNLAVEVSNENSTQAIDVWVSFIAGYIDFGEVYDYHEDPITTTSTTLTEVYFFTPNLEAGDYIVQWVAEVTNSDKNEETNWEFTIDDVTLKNTGGYRQTNDDNFISISGGFPYNNATKKDVKFSIDLSTSSSYADATIRRIMVIVRKRS